MATETATFENVYDYLGFIGGLLFAVGFIPQLYKQVKTMSSRDISMPWLMAYVLALSVYGIYLIRNKLWPILGPACLEFVLIWASIIVKIITDKRQEEDKTRTGHPVANGVNASCLESNRTLQGDRSNEKESEAHSVVELQRGSL
ncbi:hypothetical protein KFL_004270020 [Klebsormidium nitens]|uniref:Uncharacterized protein n=1 Tax=Klebsormidium nitens TaxID=105231 RepID=A0A1Y1ICV2_KLENI|nr:hypothetical protein KFL_004270020 [Klebsormidium nitens]|eukprot:GAQ88423.1 hypothetical protein KFL_004270020 [Klebsormidium nitens]